jgi:thiamine-monophosphate kinase
LVEGVHFDRKYYSAADVAWKSVAVNMSDIAAMGGRPLYVLMNLSLPRTDAGSWADEFSDAFLEAVTFYDSQLIGGDTTASRSDIVVSVSVIGRAEPANTKRRADALAGDDVVVTGWLGNSRAGLNLLSQSSLHAQELPALCLAHRRPTARLEEGYFLANASGVGAMMDVSDGLVIDLNRLASSSRCSAQIELSLLPLHPEFRKWASLAGKSPTREAALGGEDYELLATIRPSDSARVCAEFEKRFSTRLTKIGVIGPDGSSVFLENGKEQPLSQHEAFSHFECVDQKR